MFICEVLNSVLFLKVNFLIKTIIIIIISADGMDFVIATLLQIQEVANYLNSEKALYM